MKSPQSATDNPLTDRHERFVHEYLIDQNASAAAGRAGYSARTKGTQAALMMKNPVVRARIVEELGALYASLKLNAVEVLRGQVRAAYLDPAKLFDAAQQPIPLNQLDEDTRGGLTVSYAKRRDGDYTMRVKQAPRHIALNILQKRLEAFERLQAEVFAELREEAEQEAAEKAVPATAATVANPPSPIFKLDFRLDAPPATSSEALAAADSALAEAARALGHTPPAQPTQVAAAAATQATPVAEAQPAAPADEDTPPPSPHEPGYEFKKDPNAMHGGRYTAWNHYWKEKRAGDQARTEEAAALANPPPNMRLRAGRQVPVRMEPGYNPPWLRDAPKEVALGHNRPEFAIGAGEVYLD